MQQGNRVGLLGESISFGGELARMKNLKKKRGNMGRGEDLYSFSSQYDSE